MDVNPLFEFGQFSHGGSPSSSSSSAASFTAPVNPNGPSASVPPPPPPQHAPTSLQTVNIKSHVPTILDMVNPNYPEWRCFFDSVVGKFGLHSHLAAAPTAADRADPDWVMIDQCLVNWMYNTISRDVLRIVRVPGATAFTIWAAIVDLFRDHQMHRAVYLEAEYRSLYQGDLNITDYTAKLKELSDALRDLGHTVSEPSQVLNMLRGLNGKYRHTISAITSKQPPHTFLSARSFLLLEELYEQQHGKMAAHHAMVAQGSHRPASGTPSSGGPPPGGSQSGDPPPPSGGYGNNNGNRNNSGGNRNRRRRDRGNGQSSGATPANAANTRSPRPNFPNTPWAANFNPWQGMVQAWPMPFRAPATGVLGPRPGTPNQQALVAGAPTPAQYGAPPSGPYIGYPGATTYEPNALLAALASAGVPPAGNGTSDWFLDTGASSHMASAPGNFPTVQPLNSSPSVTVGNGASMPVTHLAGSSIPTSTSPLALHNILVTPSLIKNLISVRALTRDNDVSVEFDPYGFSIKDLHTRQVKLRCDSQGDLYPLQPPAPQAFHATAISVDLWHQRLGHPGRDQLTAALRSFPFNCTKSAAHTCPACQLGKHVRLPFSSSSSVSYFPFQLLHSDVWTSPVPSISGNKFYLVIIDDYSHYVWTFPLMNKSDVVPTFLSFCSYVSRQFRLPILSFQTDNGREFDNFTLRKYFQDNGIAFRLSCPYTSAQNGKAERTLRTLNDSVRTMLLHAHAPPSFWAEALATATYLLNRRPCRATGTATPHEFLFGTPPTYAHLRVFGSLCYPNQSATAANKLCARSVPCVFLGYPSDHKGYRCYDPQTRRVITSRHVVFDELQFPFQQQSHRPVCSAPTASDGLPEDDPVITPGYQAVQRRARPPSSPARSAPSSTLSSAATPTAPEPPASPSATTPTEPAAASSVSGASPGHYDATPSTSSPPGASTSSSPAAASSTPPRTPVVLERHHMVTRARDGIFKPNPRYAMATTAGDTVNISPIPSSARAALRDPNWREAM